PIPRCLLPGLTCYDMPGHGVPLPVDRSGLLVYRGIESRLLRVATATLPLLRVERQTSLALLRKLWRLPFPHWKIRSVEALDSPSASSRRGLAISLTLVTSCAAVFPSRAARVSTG